MPGTANPIKSADTHTELRRVAGLLNEIRRAQNGTEKSRLSFQIAGAKGTTKAVDVEVSSATLNQIARLIEKAEAEDSERMRRRDKELSTQKAANLLGVSRPYLVKLLDTGQIPYRLVGRYRRVRRADVELFEREEQQKRRAGLEELAAFTQEIGLEY